MQTPWGQSQTVRRITDGILDVTTSGHGGIFVDESRRLEMPDVIRSKMTFCGVVGWYEEDCDWALVAVSFPEFFNRQDEQKIAMATIKHYHPDVFDALNT